MLKSWAKIQRLSKKRVLLACGVCFAVAGLWLGVSLCDGKELPGAGILAELDGGDWWSKPGPGIPILDGVHKGTNDAIAERDGMIELRVSGHRLWVPRSVTYIGVSSSGISFASPTVSLAVFDWHEDEQSEINSAFRLMIKEPPSLTKKELAKVVRGLMRAGVSMKEAQDIVANARQALLELSDEQLMLETLAQDREALVSEKDVQKAAMSAVLQVARSSSWSPWGKAWQFQRINGNMLYVIPSRTPSNSSVYMVQEFDNRGNLLGSGFLNLKPDENGAVDPVRAFVAVFGVPELPDEDGDNRR